MGTLSLLPLSVSVCCSLRMRSHDSSSQKTHFSNSILRPHFSCSSSRELKTVKLGRKTVVFGANSGDQNKSMFMDENGVVDDMDGYLNYLSLEYDSVWDTKPSWWAFSLHSFFFLINYSVSFFFLLSFQL